MTDTSAIETPERPIHVESRAELDDLLDAHDLVLLEVYTSGCAICSSMEPILTNVARVSDAVVATFNGGDDLDLTEDLGIRSVPAFFRYEQGEIAARLADGFVETERLVAFANGETDE